VLEGVRDPCPWEFVLSGLEGVGDALPWELVQSGVGFSFMEQRSILTDGFPAQKVGMM